MVRRECWGDEVVSETRALSEDVFRSLWPSATLPTDVIRGPLDLVEPILQVRVMSAAKAAQGHLVFSV